MKKEPAIGVVMPRGPLTACVSCGDGYPATYGSYGRCLTCRDLLDWCARCGTVFSGDKQVRGRVDACSHCGMPLFIHRPDPFVGVGLRISRMRR